MPSGLTRGIVDVFDAHGVSFVSVTQAFNTTTSMGRLTLNVLLSFAQFEREGEADQAMGRGPIARRTASASATRLVPDPDPGSRPPRRRGCGWVASCHSATGPWSAPS